MNLPKLFVYIGVGFIALGCIFALAPRIPGFGRLGNLPGDIRIVSKNGTFFFPLATCLLLSAALTLLSWIIGSLRK